LNLVLSYGDLAHSGGYRTRVLGELSTLDRHAGLDPFLVVFDRNPAEFKKGFGVDIPYQVFDRSDITQFYRMLSRVTGQQSLGLIHAHNLYSAALALSARWRYGYKVVLDYHGRIPEEYTFLGKGGWGSRTVLEFLEAWCVKHSDHVVVVSQKLAEYLIARYSLPAQKISVIPCCADETIFQWDAVRRESVRKSMSLSDTFVCTHLGSFFEWYDPRMIMEAFQKIRSRRQSHLLVITNDCEKVRTYLSAQLPADTFTVRQVTHDEVPGILNASDLGLLLLRSSPNIKTSSPAKFAEYLNCGLPVLITPDVGDFSEMVAAQNLGAIMDTKNSSFELSVVDRTTYNRAELGAKCMTAGRRLTWQAYSTAWSQIVSKLS
jgi:glycosyltransferase involved in cell wall biosynthesis